MGIWPGHRGYPPTLYEKCHGILNDHRESEPRLTSHLKDVDIMIVIIIVLQFVVIIIFSRYS